MSEDIAESTTQAESLWYERRVDGPRLPFMPYGLMPLIGFALVFLFSFFVFAPHAVESPTRQAAEQVAAERDASWARIEVSGQQVRLSGEAPSASEGNALVAAVRSARAATPFGLARPARPVIADFTVTPVEVVEEVIAPTETETRGSRELSPDWTFNLTGGVLTLSGGVPDEATRDAILDAANEALDPPRLETIEDELTVTGVVAPEGYAAMATRGVETVVECERGEAAFKFERFSLRCEVSEPGAAGTVEAAASAVPELGELGPIIVMESEAVNSCETSLAALLGDARIQFAPASAEINDASDILLDAIASRVRACPGMLRIEGHTDSTADSAFNADLSLRRAEAVRQELIARDVPAERLVAEGFGETQPVATNGTVAGRARNRRIEVRVVRPPARETDE